MRLRCAREKASPALSSLLARFTHSGFWHFSDRLECVFYLSSDMSNVCTAGPAGSRHRLLRNIRLDILLNNDLVWFAGESD